MFPGPKGTKTGENNNEKVSGNSEIFQVTAQLAKLVKASVSNRKLMQAALKSLGLADVFNAENN
jgi:hypothetical protein